MRFPQAGCVRRLWEVRVRAPLIDETRPSKYPPIATFSLVTIARENHEFTFTEGIERFKNTVAIRKGSVIGASASICTSRSLRQERRSRLRPRRPLAGQVGGGLNCAAT